MHAASCSSSTGDGTQAAPHAGAGQAQGHSYILAPQRLAPGDEVTAGQAGAIRPGNCMPLASIPVATQISNVELYPGRGGQLARAAGVAATLISKGVQCWRGASRACVMLQP